MAVCAACEKTIRRNAYCWTITWDRPEGYAKKKFSASFHNKPGCIREMTERMDSYAWEQQMVAGIKASGITFDYGDLEPYDPRKG